MSTITIPAGELRAMDATIKEQAQIIREQKALLERIMILLDPLIKCGEQMQAPAPGEK
jgi:hypothetical protein